jgi:hypothetical protein
MPPRKNASLFFAACVFLHAFLCKCFFRGIFAMRFSRSFRRLGKRLYFSHVGQRQVGAKAGAAGALWSELPAMLAYLGSRRGRIAMEGA